MADLHRDEYGQSRLLGAHAGFFACGILAALWQHGHPILCLLLLPLVQVATWASHLPERQFPQRARQRLQSALGLLGLGWAVYRHLGNVPTDLYLMETFGIYGLAFLFSLRLGDLRYIIMLSLCMVGYGALQPPRTVYFFVVPVSLALALYILYRTRLSGLANRASVQISDVRGDLKWASIGLHAIILGLLWWTAVSLVPDPTATLYGAFNRSFHTPSRLPPRFRNWLQTEELRHDRQAERTTSGDDPDEASPTAHRLVQGPSSLHLPLPGSGGVIGKDLVMRVVSPLRQYWLAALYDHYDGEVWRMTAAMRQARPVPPPSYRRNAAVLEQTFIIDKRISDALYAAYQPASQPRLVQAVGVRPVYCLWRLQRQAAPALPLSYDITSYLAGRPEEASLPLARWWEELPREHYTRLPLNITGRTRSLVNAICAEAKPRTDLETAFALRDYLRTFDYSLDVPTPAAGREITDYLLFESKSGHCEYFAGAMAVMARLRGLPARVATGFAPGDYNTISGYFEVREYHAHAWTQVFIEGYGWLTMDATPPSAIQLESRATPFLLGSFRDPFSDEWRVITPELSVEAHKLVASQLAVRERQRQGELAASEGATGGEGAAAGEDPGATDGDLGRTFRNNLRAILAFATERLRGWLARIDALDVAGALAATLLMLGSLLAYPRLRGWALRRWRLRRCLNELERLGALVDIAPAASVDGSYRVLSQLLALHGLAKPPGTPLPEFVHELSRHDRRLGAEAAAIFKVWTHQRYAGETASPRDARLTWERTCRARDCLLDHQAPPARRSS